MVNGPAASSFSNGPGIKLGAMKKKCSGGFAKWALRYLILDKTARILYYYKTPRDPNPRRALDLTTCTISRLTPEESPKDPGFKITLPQVREFIFVGNNAAVVDDWINALFQAKAPTQVASPVQNYGNPMTQQAQNPAMNNNMQRGNDNSNFSYNGPTLAVLPGRGALNQPPPPDAMMQQPRPPMPNQPPTFQQQMPPTMQQQQRPINQQPQSSRSTQSTVTDQASANNTTLVAGGDTNSTLVAGGNAGAGGRRPPSNQPTTFIIMTPDNKKFPPIEKPVTSILKIGRFVGSAPQSDDMITFKSKVISRNHAEIWSVNGEVYIRDTRSQSGTFLNAMRLSEPSKESKPYRLKPGDVVQFGVDYKGATEDNARCVSVRIDLKQKMIEQPDDGMVGGMGMGQKNGEDTLVGGTTQSEATLVGQGQKNDRTIVSDGQYQQNGNYYQQGMPMPQMMGNLPPPMMNPQMMQKPPMMGPGMVARPGMGMMRPPMGMNQQMQPMMQPGIGRPPMNYS